MAYAEILARQITEGKITLGEVKFVLNFHSDRYRSRTKKIFLDKVTQLVDVYSASTTSA